MEPRRSRVNNAVRDLKDTLGQLKTIVVRMDARLGAVLPHLAGQADLAEVETRLGTIETRLVATLPHLATKADLARIEVKLSNKPSKAHICGILAALLPAYACGSAVLAVLR